MNTDQNQKLQQRIKELEIELRHLRNDYDLTRREVDVAKGNFLDMLKSLEDINVELADRNAKIEQQKAEIDNQYRLFRTLLDEIPNPVFYEDAQGNYLGCNKAFCQALGITSDKVEGKTAYEIFPRHDAELHHRMDDKLIRQGGILHYETCILFADGLDHDIVISKAAYLDAGGRILGIVAVCSDVTQSKRNELELRQSNRAKDKFFSIISHDMKNPLNALMLTTEFLQDNHQDLTKSKVEDMLGNVHNSAKRLNALLSNLLQWARSQSGRIPHEPTHLDLYNLVEQIISLAASTAREKSIELASDIPRGMFIYADRQMLMTVLRNLVSNAVKFTQPEGKVLVNAILLDDWVEITVADNGIGLSKADIDKLFRIDVHYSTKGTSRETGTGLGLILCFEFVERQGGEIKVFSEVGKGSTFRVRLPRQDAD
ncbi:MAG: PAS domain-containing protein [Candidatus Cloacimonetes bacterium]|nr:PAS domain-containing protein [Candidatus Cloacimonadota bacterium]